MLHKSVKALIFHCFFNVFWGSWLSAGSSHSVWILINFSLILTSKNKSMSEQNYKKASILASKSKVCLNNIQESVDFRFKKHEKVNILMHTFENIVFGVSRPRSLQPTHRFSIWSDLGDRHFWGHPTTQYWPKSPPPFWPFPVPARPPCLPVDRSDPGPPDICGHSCVGPLICPKIQIFHFFRRSR